MKSIKKRRYRYQKVMIRLSCLSLLTIMSGALIFTGIRYLVSDSNDSSEASKMTEPTTETSTPLNHSTAFPTATVLDEPTYDAHRQILIDEPTAAHALDALTYHIRREDSVTAAPFSLTVSLSNIDKNQTYYLILTQNGSDIYRFEHKGPVTLELENCHSEKDYRLYLLNTETIPLNFHLHVSKIKSNLMAVK